MSDKDANWKYAEDAIVESEAIASARRLSVELGIDAVSPSIGAQSALVAAAALTDVPLRPGDPVWVSLKATQVRVHPAHAAPIS